jgi:hypothetical protein
MKFETVIQDDSIQKIYSFSDIHADMDSLLICLRDCAKVIVKKEGFDYRVGEFDNNADELCNINICDSDGTYVDDLNYEWNPESKNVCVVIIGDILDGVRTESYLADMKPSNYKPQIEIKIFRFLNSLMEKAQEYNSRLIKLLGNHEINNISPFYGDFVNKYIFNENKGFSNYYRGCTRFNVFNKGKIGFDLIMKNGNGIIVKVNNNIFVHGQLAMKYNMVHYKAINKFLNNTNKSIINPLTRGFFDFEALINELNDSKSSPLWLRNFGSEIETELRITNPRASRTFCSDLKRLFTTLFPPDTGVDINKLRLVIGHCPQYFSSIFSYVNKTFTNLELSEDRTVEYISPPSSVGIPSVSNNLLFGISMECNKDEPENPHDHHIYKVDVGSSRGFDQSAESYIINNNNCDMEIYSKYMEVKGEKKIKMSEDCVAVGNAKVYNEKLLLGSRVPQVLEFSGDQLKNPRIIRSTIKNTRINQPREVYEKNIRDESSLKLSNSYYKKYLKYKNKYVALRNNYFKNQK